MNPRHLKYHVVSRTVTSCFSSSASSSSSSLFSCSSTSTTLIFIQRSSYYSSFSFWLTIVWSFFHCHPYFLPRAQSKRQNQTKNWETNFHFVHSHRQSLSKSRRLSMLAVSSVKYRKLLFLASYSKRSNEGVRSMNVNRTQWAWNNLLHIPRCPVFAPSSRFWVLSTLSWTPSTFILLLVVTLVSFKQHHRLVRWQVCVCERFVQQQKRGYRCDRFCFRSAQWGQNNKRVVGWSVMSTGVSRIHEK